MKCLDPILEKAMKKTDTVAALTDNVYDIIDSFIDDNDLEKAKKSKEETSDA